MGNTAPQAEGGGTSPVEEDLNRQNLASVLTYQTDAELNEKERAKLPPHPRARREMLPSVLPSREKPTSTSTALADHSINTGASETTGEYTTEDSGSITTGGSSYGPRYLYDEDDITALTDMAHDGDDEATIKERRYGLRAAIKHHYVSSSSSEEAESIMIVGVGDRYSRSSGISSTGYEVIDSKVLDNENSNQKQDTVLKTKGIEQEDNLERSPMSARPLSERNQSQTRATAERNQIHIVVPGMDEELQSQVEIIRGSLAVDTNPSSKAHVVRVPGSDEEAPASVTADVLRKSLKDDTNTLSSRIVVPAVDVMDEEIPVVHAVDLDVDSISLASTSGPELNQHPTKTTTNSHPTQTDSNVGPPIDPKFMLHPFKEEKRSQSLTQTATKLQKAKQNLSKDGITNEIQSQTSDDFEGIDFEFVELYDSAFNAFIENYPELMENPEMIETLRVAKLQKQLILTAQIENELDEYMKSLQAQKREMADHYHKKLLDASKKKAAREIHLQQEVDTVERASRALEGKLTLQIVSRCESSAKSLAQLKKSLSQNKAPLQDPLALLPQGLGEHETAIRAAVQAPPSEILSEDQWKEYQQLQVDNAFLNAEARVLEKKLAYVQAAAKKYEWVDAALQAMDSEQHQKLKQKLGASF